MKKSMERLEVISRTASQLLISKKPHRVVEALCKRVMEHLACHVFFNYVVDEERNCLRLNAYAGIPDETAREIHFLDYGAAVCGSAARDACRIVAENIPTTPDVRTELIRSFGIKAYACHPLFAHGRVIGTLSFGTRSRFTFTEDELSLMKAVSDQVAAAMERVRRLRSAEGRANELERCVKERTAELGRQAELLELAHDAIIVRHRKGKILFWSSGAENTYGFTKEETLGKNINTLLRTEFPVPIEEIMEAIGGEGRWEGEIVHTCKKGNKIVVLSRWATRPGKTGKLSEIMEVNRDITKRKETEMALQESERLLRDIMEGGPSLIFLKDLDGRFVTANKRTEEVIGLSREELKGKTDYDIFPRDVADYYRVHDRLVAGTGQPIQVEEMVDLADGARRLFLANKFPLFTASGKMYGVCSVSYDITERNRMEKELLRARDRAQNYLEIAGVLLMVLDDEHRITLMNRKGYEILGYEEGELTGKDWIATCLPERIRDEMALAWEKVISGEFEPVEYFEMRVLTKQGEERIIAWHNALLREETGNITGSLSSGLDITARRQAEKALLSASMYNRSLIEASLDPLITIDSKGKITDANKATELATGYLRRELIGTNFSSYFAEPKEARRGYRQVFNEGLVRDRFLRIRHKDGLSTPVLYNASVYKDEAGRVIGVLVAARDITERIQAADELSKKSKALEEMNTALKVLFDHHKNDNREFEERVGRNVRARIIPYIEKLKLSGLDVAQSALVEIVERNVRDIASPFIRAVSTKYSGFSPKEIEVIGLIREGKTTKEIAQLLGVGKRTVDSYRDSIRSKLSLSNEKVNLTTYLLSMEDTSELLPY
jgi:PAS domain S-box-containing protein